MIDIRKWIEWHGGDCPVSSDALVEVSFDDGDDECDMGGAGGFDWGHSKESGLNIIAYRLYRDMFYEEAAKLALQKNEIGLSAIQRHFKIGFNRASRLIESLVEDGVIVQNANGCRYTIKKTRTFASSEELVEALMNGERWYLYFSHPSKACFYLGGKCVLNGCHELFRELGHYEYKYCDGKTLWHRANA